MQCAFKFIKIYIYIYHLYAFNAGTACPALHQVINGTPKAKKHGTANLEEDIVSQTKGDTVDAIYKQSVISHSTSKCMYCI